METPGQRPAFDKEVDLEARQQHFVERPDDQFILTDGQNAHVRSRQGRSPALRRHPKAEARQTPSIRLLAAWAVGGWSGPAGRAGVVTCPGSRRPVARASRARLLSVAPEQVAALPPALGGLRVAVRVAPGTAGANDGGCGPPAARRDRGTARDRRARGRRSAARRRRLAPRH